MQFEPITGAPQIMASRIGSPNPSWREGKTKTEQVGIKQAQVLVRHMVEAYDFAGVEPMLPGQSGKPVCIAFLAACRRSRAGVPNARLAAATRKQRSTLPHSCAARQRSYTARRDAAGHSVRAAAPEHHANARLSETLDRFPHRLSQSAPVRYGAPQLLRGVKTLRSRTERRSVSTIERGAGKIALPQDYTGKSPGAIGGSRSYNVAAVGTVE